MIHYCRGCDLGFCDEHLKHHEGHLPKERHITEERPDLFCCVCDGIYDPSPSKEIGEDV